jgi:hypothetical protein
LKGESVERFVEVWAKGNTEWRRVAVEELATVVAGMGEVDIFQSPHIYQSKVKKDGELAAGPVYIDMDGPGALDELPTVVKYWEKLAGAENVRAFFSGMKGAHVYVNGYAMGVEPHVEYASIVKVGVELMVAQTGVKTVDMSVYSKRRLMRIPGSLHGKSGKRCAPWIEGRIANIEKPDPLCRIFSATPIVMGWFPQMREAFLAADAGGKHAIEVTLRPGVTPECVQHIMDAGLWATGTRNAVSVQLSLACKGMGMSEAAATTQARTWAEKLPQRYTSTSQAGAVRAAEANVKWAYSRPEARFVCTLGMQKIGARCPGREACSAIGEIKNAETASRVTLAEAVRPEMVDHPLTFDAIPVAVDSQPFLLPARFQLACNPNADQEPCPSCQHVGTGKGERTMSDHDLLRFTALPGEKQVFGYAKELLKVPKGCPGCKIYPTAHQNIVMGFIQPYYNGQRAETEEASRENQVYVKAGELDDQVPYNMIGRTYMHPKSLRAVHIIGECTPIRGVHEPVVLSGQDIADLEIFQAGKEDLVRKVHEIQEDWEAHVHRIYGRRLHATMMSLTWFSALAFNFQGKFINRGWLDQLIIGDTAQGKSEMAQCFLDFFDFGAMVSGENTSFAGMVAGIDNVDGRRIARKGALPRNDGGLLIVDEFGGMGQEVMASMSQARSQGKAGMSKIVQREFLCRARMLCITNAIERSTRYSINMDDVPYPISHALNLYINPEDLRRCDGVIGFRRMEETTKLIHDAMPLASAPVYGQRLSKLLQRWASSRTAAQIRFTSAGYEACISLGQTLCERYSQSIPLFVAGDTRLKLARWAIAWAGLTFSTDEKGELLIVDYYHVEAAYQMLCAMCDGPDLQFDLFTMCDAESPTIHWEEFVDLCTNMPMDCNPEGVGFKEDPAWRTAILAMLTDKPFTLGELDEVGGVKNPKFLVRRLLRTGMIKKASARAYKTSNRGIRAFKLMQSWASREAKDPLSEITREWFDERVPRL